MTRVPRYQEIADDLRRRLAAGEWPVGSPLPGISALQAEYDVRGLNVIRQAQGVLRDEGLLEPRQGSGTYVITLPTADNRGHAQLRQHVTELQHALAAVQAILNRMARQLDEHESTAHEAEGTTQTDSKPSGPSTGDKPGAPPVPAAPTTLSRKSGTSREER